jgi:hypothetical protein
MQQHLCEQSGKAVQRNPGFPLFPHIGKSGHLGLVDTVTRGRRAVGVCFFRCGTFLVGKRRGKWQEIEIEMWEKSRIWSHEEKAIVGAENALAPPRHLARNAGWANSWC